MATHPYRTRPLVRFIRSVKVLPFPCFQTQVNTVFFLRGGQITRLEGSQEEHTLALPYMKEHIHANTGHFICFYVFDQTIYAFKLKRAVKKKRRTTERKEQTNQSAQHPTNKGISSFCV